MDIFKLFFWFALSFFINTKVFAQISATVEEMELVYKDCLKNKPDSNHCFKNFWFQMDSIESVLVENVKKQLSSSEKASLIQEELSWTKKKSEFFKKLDETFRYNLQEGIWKKEMIRVSYQQKAEYILKRVRALLKQYKE